MNFLKNIFKETLSEESESSKEDVKYFQLDKMEQFDEIDEISKTKPVVLFKHSTRCSISRMALKQFDAAFNYPEEKIDWYLCDIVSINPSYHYIFIVTDRVHLAFIKSALKPNRGQLVKAS